MAGPEHIDELPSLAEGWALMVQLGELALETPSECARDTEQFVGWSLQRL